MTALLRSCTRYVTAGFRWNSRLPEAAQRSRTAHASFSPEHHPNFSEETRDFSSQQSYLIQTALTLRTPSRYIATCVTKGKCSAARGMQTACMLSSEG